MEEDRNEHYRDLIVSEEAPPTNLSTRKKLAFGSGLLWSRLLILGRTLCRRHTYIPHLYGDRHLRRAVLA